MGIFNAIHPEPINEVYFGNSKEVEEVQKQFSKFRSKYKGKDKPFDDKINLDTDLLKFDRMMENLFGFNTVGFIIEDTNEYVATIPVSYYTDSYFKEKPFYSTPSGFKFRKEVLYNCIIYCGYGFLTSNKFSDREVFATILHEVGHNFQHELSPTGSELGALSIAVGYIQNIIFTITYLMSLATGLILVEMLAEQVIKFIDKKAPFITSTFRYMLNTGVNILYAPFTPSRYKMEKIADSFVTAYGYGPEMVEVFKKFDKDSKEYKDKRKKERTFITLLLDIAFSPLDIINHYTDPHPSDTNRIQEQLYYLKLEAKNTSMDPKMKKQIIEDITKIEKQLADTEIQLKDTTVRETLSKVLGSINKEFDKAYNKNFIQ